jgi:UDP-GlcNAc:undecaprenyl-phosphate GlcNAc-1-phosphate transferase
MQPELSIPLALLVAAAVTYLVTPLAIRVAHATGFLDKPAGYKGHGNPTPYLGGSAIMAGVIVAGLAFGDAAGTYSVLGACALLVWVVGTMDDRMNLSPRLRLVLEIAIAVTLWATGHGWDAFGIAPLDLLLTIAWVVGIVNAVNLMDNMDGAAATVIGISATGTGALAIVVGVPELAPLCFAVAGGCIGFLPRNLARPSRIFMGDGGSMPLGLLVAGTSMQVASAGGLGVAGVLEVGLIVGLAVLDTTLVTFSRRRGGRPLLTGGRDHLTHRLRTRVGTPSAVAGSLASLQFMLCAVAIVAGLIGAGAILGVTAFVLAVGAYAITQLERHPWFDAPAAKVLVAETHAAQPARRPTRFVRRREHAAEPIRAGS